MDENIGPRTSSEGADKLGEKQSGKRREQISVRVYNFLQPSVENAAQQITGPCVQGATQPLPKSQCGSIRASRDFDNRRFRGGR